MRRGVVAAASAAVVLSGAIAWSASQPVTSEKLTVDAPQVCSRTADGDADLDEALPALNNGSATTLAVRSQLLANRRSLVRFDLSPCAIPASATVVDAALELHLGSAPGATRTYTVHRVTAAWVEGTVTWGNQPSVAALATSSTATGTTAGVTLAWDVQADVAALVDGSATNHGWRVGDLLESDALGVAGSFSSRDHATAAQRPVLAVTWRP